MSIDVVKISYPETFGFVVGDLIVLKFSRMLTCETETTRSTLQKFIFGEEILSGKNRDREEVLSRLRIKLNKGEEFVILECAEITYDRGLDNPLNIKIKIDKVFTLLQVSSSRKMIFYLMSDLSITDLFEKVNEDL